MNDRESEISAPLIQRDQLFHCNNSSTAANDDNSPVEQVALTVPITDDPTFPVVTFRMWVLGTISCFLLSFLNQFFWYRREPLTITSISAQIAVVPLGHLMARGITDRVFFKGSKWEFTLNPGPFNVKEHVLITIFANSGAGNPYAIHMVSAVKLFYKQKLSYWVALIVVITTQVLGFGWAGIFRRYLVDPAAMWWPQNLVQVSLFRALHDKEERAKNGLTRNQFFLIAFICSFAYYVFPDGMFKEDGQDYNISNIIDPSFHIDLENYDHEGRLYLSIVLLLTYGFSFACLTATVVHVFLFHGRELWHLSKSALQETKMDVHTKLMRKYKQVPEWWFTIMLLINIAATVFICEYYKNQLQLPWWGVLLACGIAFLFTLPIGVITATTNQTPGLNVITEYIMGYLYPGYPVANMCFKVYGYISMKQGLTFLQDLKLGHYMKIPPRAMFMAQVVGTLISAFAHLGTAWWLMDTVPNICDRALLPLDSPWTCPTDHVFYDASVVWGLIGSQRIFGNLGYYSATNWFFLIGAVAPVFVWLLQKAFPNHQWIRLISVPVVLAGIIKIPPATTVNYNSWIIIAFFSGFVVYRYYKSWWSRHNYALSGALDAGLAFMGVLLYLCLGQEHVSLRWWGSHTDTCPLASCPTAKGIVVDGCPIF